jgi:hypothetical protein
VKKPVSKFAFQMQPAALHGGGSRGLSPEDAGYGQTVRGGGGGGGVTSALSPEDVEAWVPVVGRCRLNQVDP